MKKIAFQKIRKRLVERNGSLELMKILTAHSIAEMCSDYFTKRQLYCLADRLPEKKNH